MGKTDRKKKEWLHKKSPEGSCHPRNTAGCSAARLLGNPRAVVPLLSSASLPLPAQTRGRVLVLATLHRENGSSRHTNHAQDPHHWRAVRRKIMVSAKLFEGEVTREHESRARVTLPYMFLFFYIFFY